MTKRVETGNKIIVGFVIILLLIIVCVVGYEFYNVNKFDNSVKIINQINKILKSNYKRRI